MLMLFFSLRFVFYPSQLTQLTCTHEFRNSEIFDTCTSWIFLGIFLDASLISEPPNQTFMVVQEPFLYNKIGTILFISNTFILHFLSKLAPNYDNVYFLNSETVGICMWFLVFIDNRTITPGSNQGRKQRIILTFCATIVLAIGYTSQVQAQRLC